MGESVMVPRSVGLICGYLDPERDGVADYTRRLAVHLREAGIESVIVTTHKWASAAGTGAVGVTDRWDLRGVATAARALRHLHLDLIHVQFAPSVFGFSRAVGLLPLLLPRGVPLVTTLHEYGVWSDDVRARLVRGALWSTAERRGYADRETLLLVPSSAAVLVPSPEHLAVLRARFLRQAPVTYEVPIGLNVDVTPVDRAPVRLRVRRELGAEPDARLIAFFGFLHPEKALDRLIGALATVRRTHADAHLVLVGGAESHSVPSVAAGELHRQLEQVALDYGVHDQVHFTGYLPAPQVSEVLHACDVAAFPFNAGVTRKSSSLLTALAAGVPVVATAAPGTIRGPTEFDGVLEVPPRDTAALSNGLDRILGDAALAGRLVASGRRIAASQSWDAITAAHTEVYARALASRRSGVTWTGAWQRSKVEPSTATEGNRLVTSGARDARGQRAARRPPAGK
jgi:glycosyltransferase involved in cell wall biosynthesis